MAGNRGGFAKRRPESRVRQSRLSVGRFLALQRLPPRRLRRLRPPSNRPHPPRDQATNGRGYISDEELQSGHGLLIVRRVLAASRPALQAFDGRGEQRLRSEE